MKLINFYTAERGTALGVVDGDRAWNLTAAGERAFSSATAWLRFGSNPNRRHSCSPGTASRFEVEGIGVLENGVVNR